MIRSNIVQRAFSSGEIAPPLWFRPDYLRFQTGLRTCRGFLPMVEGGFTRAPGTIFRGYSRANVAPRLIAFQFAVNDALVLEFTPGRMRVWRYGALVLTAAGAPYELAVPFDAVELADLSWVQSADVIYLATGKRPIQRLARFALNNWTIGPANFTGPFMTQNLDESLSIVASASTGTVTLQASGSIWSAGHVGVMFHLRAQHYSNIPLWTGNTDMSVGQLVRNDGKIYRLVKMVAEEGADYSTGLSWLPHPSLLNWAYFGRSSAAGSSETINTGTNAPVHETGTEQVSISPAVWWEYVSDDTGIVRVVSVESASRATAEVVRALPPNVVTDATYRWSEGAWSELRGWPRAVEIHEQRFVAAGTTSEPRTVWLSVVGDYTDFSPGVEADDAFAYAISGQASLNGIVGLKSGKRGLHIFALGQEYSSRADGSTGYLSATTAVFRVDSCIGARRGPVIAPDGDPIFVSRDGRRIMSIAYNLQDDANRSADLSRAAQHLGGEVLTEIVWQASPQRVAYIRRESGDLVAMLFDPAEDVIGWAVLPLAGGRVVSMAVTPAPDGGFDAVTLAVERTDAAGETVCTIEDISNVHAFMTGAAGPFDANHLFCAVRIAAPSGADMISAPHLAGQSVYAWTDGGEFGPLVVAPDGTVTLPAAATTGFVGLFDASHHAETLDLQAQSPSGDITGRKRRVTSAAVSLLQTAQGYLRAIERSPGDPDRVRERKAMIRVPVSSDLTAQWTGVANVDLTSGMAASVSLRIEPHGAAPLTVLGIAPKLEVTA